jgi:hypothetical protein
MDTEKEIERHRYGDKRGGREEEMRGQKRRPESTDIKTAEEREQ